MSGVQPHFPSLHESNGFEQPHWSRPPHPSETAPHCPGKSEHVFALQQVDPPPGCGRHVAAGSAQPQLIFPPQLLLKVPHALAPMSEHLSVLQQVPAPGLHVSPPEQLPLQLMTPPQPFDFVPHWPG